MDIQVINLEKKLSIIDEHWSPKVIAEMNDYHFKLAKIQGEFIWHSHSDTDEVFFVISGEMRIEFRNFHTKLSQGELCVVPKGIEHKPVAENECHIMLIELAGTLNTGDMVDERTKRGEDWI
jgi:mannose-6-phosphate isomerase-like protein (cupin superfamily)